MSGYIDPRLLAVDLVEGCRTSAVDVKGAPHFHVALTAHRLRAAADEIVRLRAELDRLRAPSQGGAGVARAVAALTHAVDVAATTNPDGPTDGEILDLAYAVTVAERERWAALRGEPRPSDDGFVAEMVEHGRKVPTVCGHGANTYCNHKVEWLVRETVARLGAGSDS